MEADSENTTQQDCQDCLGSELPITPDLAQSFIDQIDEILEGAAANDELPLDLEGIVAQYPDIAVFIRDSDEGGFDQSKLSEHLLDDIAANPQVAALQEKLRIEYRRPRRQPDVIQALRQRMMLTRIRAIFQKFLECDGTSGLAEVEAENNGDWAA